MYLPFRPAPTCLPTALPLEPWAQATATRASDVQFRPSRPGGTVQGDAEHDQDGNFHGHVAITAGESEGRGDAQCRVDVDDSGETINRQGRETNLAKDEEDERDNTGHSGPRESCHQSAFA